MFPLAASGVVRPGPPYFPIRNQVGDHLCDWHHVGTMWESRASITRKPHAVNEFRPAARYSKPMTASAETGTRLVETATAALWYPAPDTPTFSSVGAPECRRFAAQRVRLSNRGLGRCRLLPFG